MPRLVREVWASRAFQTLPACKVCLSRNLINRRWLPRLSIALLFVQWLPRLCWPLMASVDQVTLGSRQGCGTLAAWMLAGVLRRSLLPDPRFGQ